MGALRLASFSCIMQEDSGHPRMAPGVEGMHVQYLWRQPGKAQQGSRASDAKPSFQNRPHGQMGP